MKEKILEVYDDKGALVERKTLKKGICILTLERYTRLLPFGWKAYYFSNENNKQWFRRSYFKDKVFLTHNSLQYRFIPYEGFGHK